MSILLIPLRFIYVIYAFALFVALMIFVFIWALAVLPFGRIRSGNLIYRGCMLWADIWFPLIFIDHRNVHTQPLKGDESFIYVANHISYLDAALIPKTFRRPVRPLGKIEMARVPVFGFIYRNTIVTVDRSSPASRVKSVQTLKSILRKGISILVFPEGTFNTTGRPVKDFYDGAFRIAIETGTPICPVLFLHAYDRMHYRSIFSLNPGWSRSIFLPPLPVEGLTVEDVGRLKAEVSAIMEHSLRELNAKWITFPE